MHRAAAPAGTGAAGTVTYGLNLQAWCVYLIAAHAIPVHRCAELIEALTGARPSPGFVHGMIRRAAAAVAGANKLIRCLIILAHVVCADETPIRVGPGPKSRKRYLLVACTSLLTCYFLGDRSLKTFAALTPLRLRLRRRAAGQVIRRRGHGRIAAVAAQPTPQIPDLSRQGHQIRAQLPDRGRLLPDHRVPGGARRAVRGSRRQNGHKPPSSSPADSNQADKLGRLWEDHHIPGSSRHVTETLPRPPRGAECLRHRCAAHRALLSRKVWDPARIG